MGIDNINISSYSPNGVETSVDISSEWGSKLIQYLKNNISINDNISFCVLTTNGDRLKISELQQLRDSETGGDKDNNTLGHWFYCLTLLDDRLLVISCRFIKLLSLKAYDFKVNSVSLSSIDSINVSTRKTSEYYGDQYDYKINSIVPDNSFLFGYKTQYHLHINPYIELIKKKAEDVRGQKNKTNFLDDLEKLVQMRSQGFLSEDEFFKAKEKLLNID